MNNADEVLVLDHFDDAQELGATQQEEQSTLPLGRCETAATSLNPRRHQNDTLEVPETASHKDLETPESHSSEDIFDVFERASRDHTLEDPESECQGNDHSRLNILSPLITLPDASEVESDGSSSGSSLFRTQCTFTPTRTARNRSQATPPQRPSPKVPLGDSSDSSPEPTPRINLKKLFERRQRERLRRERKSKAAEVCQKPMKHIPEPCKSIPLARHQRRWKDEACPFPFLAKKDVTLRMISTYEQASLWGFFHRMKKLKCERHLQESLQNLNVSEDSEDLEDDHMEGRGYSYLDDDETISPIAESNEDSQCDDIELSEEYDAKIVDNSCFILNWEPPTKKKPLKKRKKKNKKLPFQGEPDQKEAEADGVSHREEGEAATGNSELHQQERTSEVCISESEIPC